MARLVWVKPVFSDGWHNAFTDACRWNGKYFLTFRNAEAHWADDGKIIVSSASGYFENWTSTAIEPPFNACDPKFLPTEERFYILMNGNQKVKEQRKPWLHVTWTENGRDWVSLEGCGRVQ